MGFRSDAHLLLGTEPTPPEVTAWQHPDYPDSFTATIDTADLGFPRFLGGLVT
jgi:hypothetical protein